MAETLYVPMSKTHRLLVSIYEFSFLTEKLHFYLTIIFQVNVNLKLDSLKKNLLRQRITDTCQFYGNSKHSIDCFSFYSLPKTLSDSCQSQLQY